MDLKQEIAKSLKTFFDANEAYDDCDFIEDVREILLDDIDRNGKTEFNERVNNILYRLETEDDFSHRSAIVELDELVEGV